MPNIEAVTLTSTISCCVLHMLKTNSPYQIFPGFVSETRQSNIYWATAPSACTRGDSFGWAPCPRKQMVFMKRKKHWKQCLDRSSDCVVPHTDLKHSWTVDITHYSRLPEPEELLQQIHQTLFRILHILEVSSLKVGDKSCFLMI